MRFLGFGFLLLPAALATPSALQSQSLGASQVHCKGQIISRIDISARPPFEVKGSGVQRRIARQIGDLHATTNPEVISRFLVLRPGMPCNELRRVESERILLAQPYLADASITVFPDDAGGVYLSVITVDEISLVLGGGGSGANPYLRRFRFGEGNFMGEATSIVASWNYSEDFRDNFAAQIVDYQFLGRPYQLMIEGSRNDLGGIWGVELSHPFLTDFQRISWRTTAGSREDFRYFRRDDNVNPAVMLQRNYADIGGVFRVGHPGKLALLGASLSYEDELPQDTPSFVDNGEVRPDTIAELTNRYSRHKVNRINALAGFRDIRYLRVNGFESLDGNQDVREGFEAAGVVGRGMQLFGGLDQDFFASGNIYAGGGNPSAFAAVEATLEGRHDQDTREWDGVLGSGRFATYFKPVRRHTLLSSLEWSGGWRQRIPFQVTLADKDGGPRGYRDSWLAGGHRMVLRLEDRVFIGHVKQFASIGVAPFMDFAKLWEGDVPFGVTSGINATVGFSFLASVPPRSQRMWRFDIALPLDRSSGARLRFRLVNRDFTSVFWREPRDIQRNRERSIPTSVFNWP